MELADAKVAKKFFSKTFSMRQLPLLDENFEEVCKREMRVYLVKTEEEFQKLAMKKYQDEMEETAKANKVATPRS